MVDLILLGKPDGGGLAAAISAALSGSFAVARAGAPCAAADFLLSEGAAPSCGSSGCILLCKNNFGTQLPPACPPGTVGVLRSDNLAAARELSHRQLPAITCGMAVTDTLTFSSMTAESASVCLQRSIPALCGGTVEPGELPLALSRDYGDYALMCAVAALLLSGGWQRLERAVF